jgi:hypothetical protein
MESWFQLLALKPRVRGEIESPFFLAFCELDFSNTRLDFALLRMFSASIVKNGTRRRGETETLTFWVKRYPVSLAGSGQTRFIARLVFSDLLRPTLPALRRSDQGFHEHAT